MATFLMVIGFGWAVLGLANCTGTLTNDPSDGVLMLSFLVNSILFLLPGLLIGALGARMRQSAKHAAARAATEDGRIAAAVQAALTAERARQPTAPPAPPHTPTAGTPGTPRPL